MQACSGYELWVVNQSVGLSFLSDNINQRSNDFCCNYCRMSPIPHSRFRGHCHSFCLRTVLLYAENTITMKPRTYYQVSSFKRLFLTNQRKSSANDAVVHNQTHHPFTFLVIQTGLLSSNAFLFTLAFVRLTTVISNRESQARTKNNFRMHYFCSTLSVRTRFHIESRLSYGTFDSIAFLDLCNTYDEMCDPIPNVHAEIRGCTDNAARDSNNN